MPVYDYFCKCGCEKTEIQAIGAEPPKCPTCGGDMNKKVSSPAIVRFLWDGGYPVRSKGYKNGYSKEYLKDNPPAQSSKL